MYMDWPLSLRPTAATSVRGGVEARQSDAQRQDKLLDEALKETFPASDPVSVIRIT